MDSGCGVALSQHQSGNNSHEKKADDLDQHVTGRVNAREAIPVPVRNVRCDRGQDSSYKEETDSSGKPANSRLSQNKHCQNRFEDFGAEFDRERFAAMP
jgi:hypothetical protein